MKNQLYLFIFCLIICSCSSPSKEIYIDNPGKEELTIEFEDGEKITLGPYQSLTREIEFGKRKIKVNGQAEEDIYLDPEFDYLLNPTKETYYFQKAKYFTSIREREKYYEDHPIETSKLDGMEIQGDFTKIENKILIKKTWVFGLDQEMTETAKGRTKSKKGYLTATKIHRKKTLTDRVNKETMDYIQKELEKMKEEIKE